MDPPSLDIFAAIKSTGIEFISAAALGNFLVAKTDYLSFKTIYYDLVKSKTLPLDKTKEQKLKITKSTDQSNCFLLKGDNAVLTLQLKEALIWYTKSIAAAPYPMSETDDSTTLAVAFSKRSAIYMKMDKYEAALKDIGNALSFDYPNHLKYILLTRRFECLMKLGKLDDAEKSLNEANNFVDLGSQPENKRSLLLKANKLLLCTTFFKEMLKGEREDAKEKKTNKVARQKCRPTKSYGEHPVITAASNCLEINVNKEFGRHLVATRDINPGDIIMIEEPYVCILLPDYYDTHCYNCLERSDAMIPCKHCTLVKFCSESCRNLAWTGFHDIECPILAYVSRVEFESIPALALRLLIKATKTIAKNSLQNLLDKFTYVEENDMFFGRATGFDKNHQYTSSSYLTTHLLHRNNILRLCEDSKSLSMSYYLIAAIIVDYLERYTDFFRPPIAPAAPPPSEPDMEWKIFVGSAFTMYMSIVSTNAFLVVEHLYDQTINESNKVNTGSGIYTTLSLLNHSCVNNARTFFTDGKTTVLYATRSIEKGEQIFINYGFDYGTQNLEERRSKIKYHYFTCNCEACVKDWPTEDALYFKPALAVCTGCKQPVSAKRNTQKYRCPTCKTEINVSNLFSKLYEIHERAPEMKGSMFGPDGVKDYSKELTAHSTFLSKNFRMPIVTALLLDDVFMENFFGNMGNHYAYSPDPPIPQVLGTSKVGERER